jgi:acid phosphatase type 7
MLPLFWQSVPAGAVDANLLPACPPWELAQAPPEAAPVHRFWSPLYARHFYTIDEAEKDRVLARYADIWLYEQPAFRALPTRIESRLAPVHRFWSGQTNSHFYTLSEAEADWLLAHYPHVWIYEGVGFYAYPPGDPPVGTVPVHRFWSPVLGTHLHTVSDRERFEVVSAYADVWQYEGVAWYAYPPDDSPVVQIVKGPLVQWTARDCATILWETDRPAGTSIRYSVGLEDSNSICDPAFATLHKVVLAGLAPDTLYACTIASGPASRSGTFPTAPRAGRPFRFAVYGDTRTYPDIHAQIAAGILESRPQIVFHTGDLVGAGGNLHAWETEFFRPAAKLMASVPLIAIPGNHEQAGWGPPWFFYFFDRPIDEGWFALSYGDIRFIGLATSAPYTAGSPQHEWLSRELASAESRGATWRIVLLHESPFTSTNAYSDSIGLLEHIVPLFERHGVDVAFSGHSHVYERYAHRGVTYIVTAGGGAPLYELTPDFEPPIRRAGRSVYHHCVVDVDPAAGTLTIAAVDLAGEVFDTAELRK